MPVPNRCQYVPVQAVPVHQYECVQENPFLEEINLTTGQKLTRHDIFTSSWDEFFWMGDGGAAPMEVEMGEEEARNPTSDFVINSERRP